MSSMASAGVGQQLARKGAHPVVCVLDQDEGVHPAVARGLGVGHAAAQPAQRAEDPDPARKRGGELIFDGPQHIAHLKQPPLTIQPCAPLRHGAEDTDPRCNPRSGAPQHPVTGSRRAAQGKWFGWSAE